MRSPVKVLLFLLTLLPFFVFSSSIELTEEGDVPIASSISSVSVDSERIEEFDHSIFWECMGFCCFCLQSSNEVESEVSFAIVLPNPETYSLSSCPSAQVYPESTVLRPVFEQISISSSITNDDQIRSDQEFAEHLMLMEALGPGIFAEAIRAATRWNTDN